MIFLLSISKIYAQINFGIDVSKYQNNIDIDKLDNSVTFVVMKATESNNKIDPKFHHNWELFEKKKVLRGAYHYFRPEVSGYQQAKLFLKTVNFKSGYMLPVIDVEYSKRWRKLSKRGTQNLNEMINCIEKELKVTPIIYTSASFWDQFIDKHFLHYHHIHFLWLADYREQIKLPKKWNEWTMWQYSNKGRIEGIKTHVDLNMCKIHLDSLKIK